VDTVVMTDRKDRCIWEGWVNVTILRL